MLANPSRYLRICHWAMRRYSVNGVLIVSRGATPSRYERIQMMAWDRYL
jgi:hypothetical protein